MCTGSPAKVYYIVRVYGPGGWSTDLDHDGWGGVDGVLPGESWQAAQQLAAALATEVGGEPPLGLPEHAADVLETVRVCGVDPLACVVAVCAPAPGSWDAPHGWRAVYRIPVSAAVAPRETALEVS